MSLVRLPTHWFCPHGLAFRNFHHSPPPFLIQSRKCKLAVVLKNWQLPPLVHFQPFPMTFESKPFLTRIRMSNRKNLCPHGPPHLTMLGFSSQPCFHWTTLLFVPQAYLVQLAQLQWGSSKCTFLYSSEWNMGSLWGHSWKEPIGESIWNRPSSSGCFL